MIGCVFFRVVQQRGTDLEIGIFGDIPRSIIGTLPSGLVLVKTKGCRGVEVSVELGTVSI